MTNEERKLFFKCGAEKLGVGLCGMKYWEEMALNQEEVPGKKKNCEGPSRKATKAQSMAHR
jgi:hypothetical protein